MFDITIYYKDGRRSFYDHVAQVTNISNDNIVIDFITDFNDHINKAINAAEVDRIIMRLML